MSARALNWAWNDVRGIRGVEKTVLARLADFADDLDSCYPGKDRLAADCCLSKRTVDQAIKALEEKGLISIERRKLDRKGREDPDGKKQTSNRYVLNLDHTGQEDLFRGAPHAGVQDVQGCISPQLGVQDVQGEGAGGAPEPLLEPKHNQKEYSATGVAGREQGYKSKSGKTLSGKALDQFEYFWKIFHEGWEKRGKAEAADEWHQLTANRELPPRTWSHIIAAAKAEAKGRAARLEKGLTPPMASRWLSSRRWEDYDPPAPNAAPAREERPRQWYETWDGITERACGYGLTMYQCDDELDLLDKLIAKLREKREGVPQGLLDYREVIAKRAAA